MEEEITGYGDPLPGPAVVTSSGKFVIVVMSPVGTENKDGTTQGSSPGGPSRAGAKGQTPSIGIGFRF